MSQSQTTARPAIRGWVTIPEQMLREIATTHVLLDQMLLDELSGRPWVLTVTRRRRMPRERVNQIREVLARKIAPWAMYYDEED